MDPSEAEPMPARAADGIELVPFNESRWPPAAAVFMFMILNIAMRIWLPREQVIAVPWLLPTLEAAVLGVLVFGRPADSARHRRWLRPTAVTLAALMVAAALWATVRLIDDLIHGSAVTNDPARLLAAGALVWLGNNLSFSLLYWLIDSGGPIMRARRLLPSDFAFTQHMSPELAPRAWRPVFLDYLHLGFTNATAFSPTDVMPLTHRAKYTMLVQSTVALALFGLIVARAVTLSRNNKRPDASDSGQPADRRGCPVTPSRADELLPGWSQGFWSRAWPPKPNMICAEVMRAG